MRKKRILHAIGNLSMGGAEFQCLQLTNNLDANKYEVAIVYFHDGPNPDVNPDVSLFKIERGAYWNLWSIWKQIDYVIAEFQPDVVQAWLPEVISVPAAIAAARCGISVISGHRNTLAYEGDLNKAVRDRLRLPQYLLAQRIVSNFSVEEEPFPFRWLYRRKSGQCVFNGIDAVTLRALKPKQLPIRAECRLMFAGRLVPQKGIPVALRAIHLLTGQGYDVHLTLFGEGPAFYVAELHKLVRELGIEDRVTFYGECRDWQAYAQDASALIFPTQGEGTSNVILEALTVGLPVVISDIAMSRQLLRDKETALIVQSNDPKDWSSRIAEMLDSDELIEGLRKEGKHLSERFSIAQMVEAYSELYDELSADVK